MGFLAIEDINLSDAFLETMALVAYVFVVLMIFYAKKKNKIFASKGFPVLVLAIFLGLLSGAMDLFTELYWFDTFEQYQVFKLLIAVFQIASLLIFALSLVLVFKFTKYMMGED